jgi:hypothetical protein
MTRKCSLIKFKARGSRKARQGRRGVITIKCGLTEFKARGSRQGRRGVLSFRKVECGEIPVGLNELDGDLYGIL